MNKIEELDNQYSKLNGIDIREKTISEIHSHYQQKKFTCFELVNYYLQRIKVLNPYINALIQVNEEALEIAKEYDNKIPEMKDYSLFGIPIIIKDNIATRDKLKTTCGSLALVDTEPKQDSTVVSLLRKAGVIIIGKANMTEFAGFRDEIDPLGWSARGNQTNNPYLLTKHASGSSSGSAASVAANLAMISLGTETDGSIIAPSSTCSLVGLKPTVGITSRAGVIPLSFHQDSVGVISRTVEDNLRVLKVIYNHSDPRDSLSTTVCADSVPELGFNDVNNMSFKIGFVEKPYFELEIKVKETLPQFYEFINQVNKKDNISVINGIHMNTQLFSFYKQDIVFEHELKHYFNKYLKDEVNYLTKDKINSLDKVIQFNIQNKELELSKFGQSLLISSNKTSGIDNPEYKRALEDNRKGAIQAINELMDKYNVEYLMGPAEPDAVFFSSAAIAAYPIITIPFGSYNDGEPFGIAIIAKPLMEAKLLTLANYLENMIGARQKPKFRQ